MFKYSNDNWIINFSKTTLSNKKSEMKRNMEDMESALRLRSAEQEIHCASVNYSYKLQELSRPQVWSWMETNLREE